MLFLEMRHFSDHPVLIQMVKFRKFQQNYSLFLFFFKPFNHIPQYKFVFFFVFLLKVKIKPQNLPHRPQNRVWELDFVFRF